MSAVGTLIQFSPLTTISSDDVDQNNADLKAAINSAVFTDQVNTITANQRLANAVWLMGRNAGDTADVLMWRVGATRVETGANLQVQDVLPDTDNARALGSASLRWAEISTYALEVNAGIALGGGSAPTLGTIGGSGPAVAGQNSWLEVTIGGVASYLPVWR